MVKPTLMIATAALFASAAASSAALVSFSSTIIDPTNATGSYLNNSGSILEAVSFGPNRAGPYTYNAPTASSNPNNTPSLNGITFTSSGTLAAGVSSLNGSFFSLTQSNGAATINYDSGRFSNISSTNQGLFGLAYDVARTGANDSRMILNLANLTIGSSYTVQLIFSTLNTADNPAGNLSDRTVQLAAGAFTQGANAQVGTGADGTSAIFNYGPTTGAIVVNASFTADGTSEALNLLSNTTNGNSRVSLAGIVVSQVPEASTSMLAAAGVAALAFARRRKSA